MKKEKAPAKNIFDQFEMFCSKHSKTLLVLILSVFSLLSLLLFNMRVSIGGDDSTYIIRAANFINEGTYPSFQGPIYPLFLSVFIGLFSIKLGLLKLLSFALMLGSLLMFYKAFKDRVPYALIFVSLLMLSVSNYFIFFTSQTYSEALFLFLQLPVFILLFKDMEAENGIDIKRLVLMSLLIVLGYLTRTVGLGTLIAVIVFYMLTVNYKKAGIVLLSSIGILFVFLAIKYAIWQNGFFDSGQASTLMYQHPYDKTKGLESFGGFLMRFVDNSNLYLSKQFLKMIGLRSLESKGVNGFITLILYGLFIFGFVKSIKKNKYLYFTSIYVAVMLGITFFVLQKIWDQYRLIVPFFPFMILVLLFALDELRLLLKNKFIGLAFAALIIYSIGSSFLISTSKIDLMTLRKNIRGDKLLGYTDDWVNYLSMAEYVNDKLPEDAYVAVRKPNMARLYANGRKFYGIYRYDTEDPDELLQRLKDKNVTHMLMASLRKNPAVYNKQTINTIQRYMYIIIKKYPQIFRVEHRIGQDEPAYLFEIRYDMAYTQEQLDANLNSGK